MFAKKRKTYRILFYIIFILVVVFLSGYFSQEQSYIIDMFTVSATIIGIFFIYLEFRRSRNIEEANFIFSLNSQFNNDDKIQKIYNKFNNIPPDVLYNYFTAPNLKRKKELLYSDVDEVSYSVNFFTFFETIYILIEKDIITLKMIDNLFAGRFFKITNDPVIQDLRLVKNKKHYSNIYDLHQKWRDYRIDNRKSPLYPETSLSKHYDFIDDSYELKPLHAYDINDIIDFEKDIVKNLKDKDVFSGLDKETLQEILIDKTTMAVGVYKKHKTENELAAIGFLTTYKHCNELFYKQTINDSIDEEDIFYIKTIAVKEKYRGINIQSDLVNYFERYVQFIYGKAIVLVVQKNNTHSIENFSEKGFKYIGEIELHKNFKRNIMEKIII